MHEVIFITGLPRSGTKLLRELLNRNTRISIPQIETVLIPYFINKYGLDFDLNKKDNFLRICRAFKKSTFYHDYKKVKIDIEIETIFNKHNRLTWASFFEEILKFYGPKDYSQNILIGDKTPGYIDHTEVILSIWPKAKIIHIIRDPRDYVWSANNVWKKNLLRSAARWNRTMVNLEKNKDLTLKNYLVVYYENLLEDPENVMEKVCQFLNIGFQKNMLTLERSIEKYGDAKGATSILKSNKNKYRNKFSTKQIYNIEQVVKEGALIHGYRLDNPEVKPKTISRLSLFVYKIQDGVNALLFHIRRQKNIWKGARYFVQLHKQNLKK